MQFLFLVNFLFKQLKLSWKIIKQVLIIIFWTGNEENGLTSDQAWTFSSLDNGSDGCRHAGTDLRPRWGWWLPQGWNFDLKRLLRYCYFKSKLKFWKILLCEGEEVVVLPALLHLHLHHGRRQCPPCQGPRLYLLQKGELKKPTLHFPRHCVQLSKIKFGPWLIDIWYWTTSAECRYHYHSYMQERVKLMTREFQRRGFSLLTCWSSKLDIFGNLVQP